MTKRIASFCGFAALLMTSSSGNAQDWCETQRHLNEAERTICGTPWLRDRDEVLNEVYRTSSVSTESQRAWIRRRNACGNNKSCLGDAYRERLRAIGGDAAAAGRSY
jgi:uncharacterized protein